MVLPRTNMAEEWILPRKGTLENPLRLAVLLSGSGSGMVALLNHQMQNKCLHETVLVISDRNDAKGLEKAESLGFETHVVLLPDIENKFQRRREHEGLIHQTLIDKGVELIILSGYMRILTPDFVKPWAGRILNIHPSLLPDFPGAHAHRDALAAGAKTTGCTVHFVDSGMDTGPIIAQKSLAVHEDDTEETLSERVKKLEHELYPKVIDSVAAGEIESP